MIEPTAEQMRAFRILLERVLGDKETGLMLVPSPHPGFIDLKFGQTQILSRLSIVKVIADSKHSLRAEQPTVDVLDTFFTNLLGVGGIGQALHADLEARRAAKKPPETMGTILQERDKLRRELAEVKDALTQECQRAARAEMALGDVSHQKQRLQEECEKLRRELATAEHLRRTS